jgi:transmembrane sensor
MTGARENRIRREASRWVVKFDGEFHAEDVRAFRRWLAHSEDHRAAFEHASATWNQLDLLSRLEAYPLPANDTAARSVDRRVLLGGGAVAVAALGIGVYALGSGAAEAYETGVGEVRDIALSDGTNVTLNASTRVETRISSESRAARVVRGEALFVISERGDQPFSISTDAGGVEATNGEVLVKVLPDGVRVSLMSARGRAWRAGLISRPSAVAIDAHSDIELGRGDLSVAPIELALLPRRTLWREGRLAFDDTPLSEAVADVSRHTGARFGFADPALGRLRIGGLIDARDLDGFLLMLSQSVGVGARRRGDGVIELSSTAPLAP